MKKCILHVELVYHPRSGCGNAENNSDGHQFQDWAECLVVVDAVQLREAMNHPSCLVASKRANRVEFMFENPLASYHISTRRSREKSPGVIVDQGLVLIHHSCSPVLISKCAAVVGRNLRNYGSGSGEIQVLDRRLQGAGLGACQHPLEDRCWRCTGHGPMRGVGGAELTCPHARDTHKHGCMRWDRSSAVGQAKPARHS